MLAGGKGLLPLVFSSSSHSSGLQLPLCLPVKNKMSHFRFIRQLCKVGELLEWKVVLDNSKMQGRKPHTYSRK